MDDVPVPDSLAEADLPDLDALRRVHESIGERTPYYDWLGLQLVALERGRATVRLPFDDRLITPSPPTKGVVHGGVIATLVDVAGVAALDTVSSSTGAPTTDLDVSFHAPAKTALRAVAEVESATERVGTASVRVLPAASDGDDAGDTSTGDGGATGGDGSAVATATVTCRLGEE